MKKSFATLFGIFLIFTALAAPIDANTAQNIALTFWNQSTCAMKAGNVQEMQNVTSATETVSLEWRNLLEGRLPATKGTSAVQPLVTAKWGQGSPYNALCPDGLRVGCVAVAVEMEYLSNVSLAYVLNSTAHPYNAEKAMKTNFGFSATEHGEYREDYNKATWISMLKADLDAGHPLIYNGYNSSNAGGHCFVCDGYDNNNYFHFNWGLNGSYDGYFEIDAMTPSNQDFSYNQGAIFSLVPAGGVGIEEVATTASIFPNPTDGLVHINTTGAAAQKVQVFDISGKIILKRDANGREFTVDLSNCEAGSYIMRVITDKGIETCKVVRN